jgi:macrodomain Ter protein organizer (MatP/YcbG family)
MRGGSRMVQIIHIDVKKNSLKLNEWLNAHAGCDVDKMMHGDEAEKKKSLRHFDNETIKARSKLIGKN